MPTLPSVPTQQSVFSTGALAPQQIQSSPADFGGQVGQAGQQLGNTMVQAGSDVNQIANSIQAIQNETDTNYNFANNLMPGLRQQSQAYYALQGKDAVDQLPVYQQKMQDLQQQVRSQLANPMQQKMFDEVSRRAVMNEMDGMGRYADVQNKVYQQQASDGMVNAFAQTAAQHWNDPNAFNGSLQSIAIERSTHGMTVGQPVEYTNAQITKDVSGSWIDRLKGYASAGNAAGALQMLNSGEDWTDTQGRAQHTDVRSQILAAQLPAIQSELSQQAADQIGVQIGNTSTAPATPAVSVGVGVRNNNPGNLKDPATGNFQTFPTQQQGIQAADQNLLGYQTQHGINTIADVVSRWAPKGDGNNNPAAYASAVSAATGIPSDQKIDLTNSAVRTKVLNAMFDVESPGWRQASQGAPGAASGAVTGTLPVANVQAVSNASAIAPPPVGLATDPAAMKASQDATSEQARQAAQAHTLQLTGDPIAAKRAGDVAAATVAGNTNAAISAQEARQRAAAGGIAKIISGDPSTNTPAVTSFQGLMSSAQGYANYSQLSPEGQAAVISRLSNTGKVGLTQDGLNAYYQYRGQAANDPDAFAKVDLSTMYGKLPEPQLLDLINLQEAIAKGGSSQSDKSLNWARTKGDVDDMLKPLGFGTAAKASTDEAKKTEQFYGKLQQQLEAYHDQNQKYPDTVATRKLAAALLTQGTQGASHWYSSSSTIPAFESTDLSKFSVPVPDDQRPALAQTFQKVMGHSPSDEELGQWYTRYSLSQKSK